MTDVLRKLNFKSQTPVLVFGAPKSFQAETAAMQKETKVHLAPKPRQGYAFAIAFAAMKVDLVKAARLVALGRAPPFRPAACAPDRDRR